MWLFTAAYTQIRLDATVLVTSCDANISDKSTRSFESLGWWRRFFVPSKHGMMTWYLPFQLLFQHVSTAEPAVID